MKVFLFRHGEKEKILSDNFEKVNSALLTSKGIAQIAKLGQYLKIIFPELSNLSQIFTSPLSRSLQSAEVIQKMLGIENIVIDDTFYELYVTKDLKKMKDEHLITKSLLNPHISFGPRGSINSQVEKIIQYLHESQSNGEKLMLVSTHSILIRALCYHLDPMLQPPPNQMKAGKLHEASLTILSVNNTDITIQIFNEYSFLPTQLQYQMYNRGE